MARSRHSAARSARDGCGTLVGRLLGMGQSHHTPAGDLLAGQQVIGRYKKSPGSSARRSSARGPGWRGAVAGPRVAASLTQMAFAVGHRGYRRGACGMGGIKPPPPWLGFCTNPRPAAFAAGLFCVATARWPAGDRPASGDQNQRQTFRSGQLPRLSVSWLEGAHPGTACGPWRWPHRRTCEEITSCAEGSLITPTLTQPRRGRDSSGGRCWSFWP
jgi:hypothetical protein